MFEAPQYTTVKSDYAPPDAVGPAGSAAAAAAAAAGGGSTGGDGGRAVQLPLRTGEAMMVLGQTADKNWYLGASAGCRRYEGVSLRPSCALIENPHFSTFGMSAQDMHVGADQNQNRNKHNSGSGATLPPPTPASPHSQPPWRKWEQWFRFRRRGC